MQLDEPDRCAGEIGEATMVPGRPVAVQLARGPLLHHAADQLAALAAQAADAPTGMVQLVEDNRVLLYGGYGMSDQWSRLPLTPISATLAGLVLDGREPLIMEDLASDERVPAGAPAGLVGARAYAGYPVCDGDGEVVGVCCVLDTEPRPWTPSQLAAVQRAAWVCASFVDEQTARQEVDRQRRFLDAVLNSLDDGVAACDADGRLVLVNARMHTINPDLVDGLDLTAPDAPAWMYHTDGRALVSPELPLLRALRGERVRHAEVVVRRPGSRHRVWLSDGEPIVGTDGKSLGAVVAVHDVTDRRRAERFRTCELAVTTALAEATSAEQAGPRVLEAIVSTLGWVHAELWLVDPTIEVLRPTARWSAPGPDHPMDVPDTLQYGHGLAGRAWQAAKPLWIRDIGNPQSLISVRTALTSQLHTALAMPVRSGHGIVGVLTFFADVTEDPEDALVALLSGIAAHVGQFLEHRQVEDLQLQLARTKDEYLALVGHELRTPLTSIAAYTGLLREADAPTLTLHGPALLEVIERNTTHLRQIIDDLLELAALDTGHARIEAAPCDLARVVREAITAARRTLATSPLTLSTELPDQLIVPGDGERLRQVVDNLLGNAIKYSPDGGHIDIVLRGVDTVTAELTVTDTGIGIPPDEREQLFSRLYRTSRARDRAIPGTGLGLALTRAIVERHHGSVVLAHGEHPGTRVVVRLPLTPR